MGLIFYAQNLFASHLMVLLVLLGGGFRFAKGMGEDVNMDGRSRNVQV